MKIIRIIYYISTALMSLIMLFSAAQYCFAYEEAVKDFARLGFPSFLIYPLATVKVAGVIVIWLAKDWSLVSWSYAGFFFVSQIAFLAHINARDGLFFFALISLILVVCSHLSARKCGKLVRN